MARTGSMAAWIAGGAVALLLVAPAPARACDAHPAKAESATSVDARLKAEAGEATAKQPEQLAEKCKCDGPADCSCKKGQCKCAKCSKPRRYKVMESLRDEGQARERPVRRNAAAGSFI